ncbi:MAG: hypothetical protein JXQ29_12540, partial [Planctomycetes bacterium]|nr:hypothetical protein [Planctomycetota bacterium]
MTGQPDHALLVSLPLPLARAWRRVLCTEAPEAVHERAVFALEAALKFAAAASTAAWVTSGAEGSAPQKACEALVRPSLGHWAAMLRACLGALPEGDPTRAWIRAARTRTVTAAVPGLAGGNAGMVLDALPAYRNAVSGHGAGLPSSKAAERAPRLVALAREVLASLVSEEAPVLAGRAAGQCVLLTGLSGVPRLLTAGSPSADLVLSFAGSSTPLCPLWIYDPDWDDVLVLNKGAGLPKVEYLSYGLPHGETGLVVRRGMMAEQAARFLETATGKGALGARDVAALIEEAEVRALEAQATAQRIGPYRVVRQAAKGGQGILYEAIQEDPPRRVALKVLQLQLAVDEAARRRFREEGAALARVEHPGVVPV